MKTMNDLEKSVNVIEKELKRLFQKPENPELEFAYIQLILGGGNLCKGIRESWADS